MTQKSFSTMRAILFTTTFCLGNFSWAKTFTVESGEVKFVAIGKPGFLKINGHSNQKAPEGEIQVSKEGLTAKFAIAISHFDTGISLRNEHMKEKYLEVQKFPEAQLKVAMPLFKEESLHEKYEGDFAGELTLHGETRPVQGKLSFEPVAKMAKASFAIKVSDFKIDVPKYMGVTVSETVDVTTEIKLRDGQ